MTMRNESIDVTEITLAEMARKPASGQKAGRLFVVKDGSPAPYVVIVFHAMVGGALFATYLPLSGGGAGGAGLAQYLADTHTTAAGTPGVQIWSGALGVDNITFGFGLKLRAILSATAGAATLRLKNLTTGQYVHIGTGDTDNIAVTSTTPTLVESVNLVTGGAGGGPVTNFVPGSNDLYALEVFSDGAATATVGSVALIATQASP